MFHTTDCDRISNGRVTIYCTEEESLSPATAAGLAGAIGLEPGWRGWWVFEAGFAEKGAARSEDKSAFRLEAGAADRIVRGPAAWPVVVQPFENWTGGTLRRFVVGAWCPHHV